MKYIMIISMFCSRVFSALVAGVVTGIVGVTGFLGFLIFIASQIVVRSLRVYICLFVSIHAAI